MIFGIIQYSFLLLFLIFIYRYLIFHNQFVYEIPTWHYVELQGEFI
jgi:hypothetical protein